MILRPAFAGTPDIGHNDFMQEILKRCKVCGEEKPLSDFAKIKGGLHGRRNWCRPCAAEHLRQWREKNRDRVQAYTQEYNKRPERREKHRERSRARYHANKDRARNDYLVREFGISLTEYNDLLVAQNGSCAICKKSCKSGRKLAVDHCHMTGKVRALLCMNCNRAIGWMDDDPDRLMAAAAYVISHRDGLQKTN